jgi:hypothetical protein
MNGNVKKSFIGKITSLLLGNGCCWRTSLAVWLVGASILSVLLVFVTRDPIYFILLGTGLAAWGIFLILRLKGCCAFLNK